MAALGILPRRHYDVKKAAAGLRGCRPVGVWRMFFKSRGVCAGFQKKMVPY